MSEQLVKIYIYALVDPRCPHIVRYVGQTSDWNRRLLEHVKNGKARSSKEKWLVTMRSEGVLPQLVVLEENNHILANERERWWTERAESEHLTNDVYSSVSRARYRDPKPKIEGELSKARRHLDTLRITAALANAKGNKSKAAKELGISRPTLYEQMEKLGL